MRIIIRVIGWLKRCILNYQLDVYRSTGDMGAIAHVLFHSKQSQTRWILKKMGASIAEDAYLDRGIFIHNAKKDYKNFVIKAKAYLGPGVFLDLSSQIVIEERVVVSLGAVILTHFDGGSSDLAREKKPFQKPVTVEAGAYVGAGATLFPGVTIGAGAVIGARAVVTHDVAPGEIVAGNPAQDIWKKDRK